MACIVFLKSFDGIIRDRDIAVWRWVSEKQCFFLLWEAGKRYTVCFYGICLLLMEAGICELRQWMAGSVKRNQKYANMWRITDDFWDRWELLKPMFWRCRRQIGSGCLLMAQNCGNCP